jgi:Mg2+-importing ATPase
MDVLCTDKTGTLTEGAVRLEGAYDTQGERSTAVLAEAALNAALQTGLENPLDAAILQAASPDLGNVRKLAEVPYDFVRRRLSVVLGDAAGVRLVTKGAFEKVLQVCTTAQGVLLDSRTRDARPGGGSAKPGRA